MRNRIGQALAVAIPILIASGAGFVIYGHIARLGAVPPEKHSRHLPAPRVVSRGEYLFHAAVHAGWLNGVAIPRDTALPRFTAATGERPQVVQVYTGLTGRFPRAMVRRIAASGALPLLQINPRDIPLSRVVSGAEDGLLARYAAAVRSAGVTVGLSFAHEANGDWYPWGCRHTAARVYIRAWRHVHRIIGTRDVIWVWTADRWHGSRCPLLARYPGNNWTDWAGVDGYLRRPGETFASIFGPALHALQSTGKPVLVAEAGVPAGPGQAKRIRSLYGGARASGCLGIVYFDSATRKGDYRPQDHPGALAAFAAAISPRSHRPLTPRKD